jgi:hypothetical protein
MSGKTITPALGLDSFTCPQCNAIAHQTWYSTYLRGYEKDSKPNIPDLQFIEMVEQSEMARANPDLVVFFKRKLAKDVFKEWHAQSRYLNTELVNLYCSYCYSCKQLGLWVADNLIYPVRPTSIQPSTEMPADVRVDFLEATFIVDQSPRGAAALLRLCVQKLMPHLGQKGKNVDADIGALVKAGLDGRIQQALDVVRVVGNNAVHPGQIDLRDNKAAALQLFDLVNLIVEAMIATPKHIQTMYGALPEAALKAIEKRDGRDNA